MGVKMKNKIDKNECESTLNKYFYFINCSEMERELCNMEMRSIFGKEPKGKYLFSEKILIHLEVLLLNCKLNQYIERII